MPQAAEVEKLAKKRYVREKLSEGEKVTRAMKATPDLPQMMAPEILQYWQTVSLIKRVLRRPLRLRAALAYLPPLDAPAFDPPDCLLPTA